MRALRRIRKSGQRLFHFACERKRLLAEGFIALWLVAACVNTHGEASLAVTVALALALAYTLLVGAWRVTGDRGRFKATGIAACALTLNSGSALAFTAAASKRVGAVDAVTGNTDGEGCCVLGIGGGCSGDVTACAARPLSNGSCGALSVSALANTVCSEELGSCTVVSSV